MAPTYPSAVASARHQISTGRVHISPGHAQCGELKQQSAKSDKRRSRPRAGTPALLKTQQDSAAERVRLKTKLRLPLANRQMPRRSAEWRVFRFASLALLEGTLCGQPSYKGTHREIATR